MALYEIEMMKSAGCKTVYDEETSTCYSWADSLWYTSCITVAAIATSSLLAGLATIIAGLSQKNSSYSTNLISEVLALPLSVTLCSNLAWADRRYDVVARP